MKVSIIGLGRVGSTLAYTLLLQQLVDELVLVNRTHNIAEGDAMDLQHVHMFVENQTDICAGDIPDTAHSDVIAMCASIPQPAELKNRFETTEQNVALFRKLIPPLAQASPNAKFVIFSNPVDVLTWHTIQLSGFKPNQVMGTGTLVDSARFRKAIGTKMGIHPLDVRAYVLGEHGDSQFPAFSAAQAGGESIHSSPALYDLFKQSASAGIDIFRKKGHTNFAIAMAGAYIIRSIAENAKHTIPLSVLVDGYLDVHDVCLSMPAVVGENGIERLLQPTLNEEETRLFQKSAAIIRKVIHETSQ